MRVIITGLIIALIVFIIMMTTLYRVSKQLPAPAPTRDTCCLLPNDSVLMDVMKAAYGVGALRGKNHEDIEKLWPEDSIIIRKLFFNVPLDTTIIVKPDKHFL